jgi:hypothetical protein
VCGVARDRARVVEIVEAQVQRAARGNRDAIGTDRLVVGEEYGNFHVSVAIAGVEDARGLV